MSRVALYVEDGGAGLVRCARQARRGGDRVVAVASERADAPVGARLGVGGPVLRRLVGRMRAGEFEAIVASLEAGGPLVRLALQDDGGLPERKRPRRMRARPRLIRLPPQGRTAAIYARSATADLGRRSIEDQTERCRAYAARRGWTVVGTYADSARSGMTLDGRTGFAELIAAAERGAFQVLVVEDLDRLGRDAVLVHGVLRTLQDMGVTLCTVENRAPLAPGAKAAVVRRIFDGYAAGASVSDICRGLNADGEDRS